MYKVIMDFARRMFSYFKKSKSSSNNTNQVELFAYFSMSDGDQALAVELQGSKLVACDPADVKKFFRRYWRKQKESCLEEDNEEDADDLEYIKKLLTCSEEIEAEDDESDGQVDENKWLAGFSLVGFDWSNKIYFQWHSANLKNFDLKTELEVLNQDFKKVQKTFQYLRKLKDSYCELTKSVCIFDFDEEIQSKDDDMELGILNQSIKSSNDQSKKFIQLYYAYIGSKSWEYQAGDYQPSKYLPDQVESVIYDPTCISFDSFYLNVEDGCIYVCYPESPQPGASMVLEPLALGKKHYPFSSIKCPETQSLDERLNCVGPDDQHYNYVTFKANFGLQALTDLKTLYSKLIDRLMQKYDDFENRREKLKSKSLREQIEEYEKIFEPQIDAEFGIASLSSCLENEISKNSEMRTRLVKLYAKRFKAQSKPFPFDF